MKMTKGNYPAPLKIVDVLKKRYLSVCIYVYYVYMYIMYI